MNKKRILAILSLVALLLAGGTIAYYSSSMVTDNKLNTKEYKTEVVEKFKPDTDMKPGAKIEKNVTVKNTGDYGLIARVKYEDKWNKDAWQPKEKAYPLNETNKALKSTDVLSYNESNVAKVLDATNENDWVLVDGYYYYNKVINPEGAVKFLDYINVNPELDVVGNANIEYYYTTAATEPSEIGADASNSWLKVDNEEAIPKNSTFKKAVSLSAADSYSGANYSLVITTEVLQATKEAVDATTTWSTVATNPQLSDLYSGLEANK